MSQSTYAGCDYEEILLDLTVRLVSRTGFKLTLREPSAEWNGTKEDAFGIDLHYNGAVTHRCFEFTRRRDNVAEILLRWLDEQPTADPNSDTHPNPGEMKRFWLFSTVTDMETDAVNAFEGDFDSNTEAFDHALRIDSHLERGRPRMDHLIVDVRTGVVMEIVLSPSLRRRTILESPVRMLRDAGIAGPVTIVEAERPE